ncbi:MAG: hypothetical protein AB1576_01815 [Bacillota bacterium]
MAGDGVLAVTYREERGTQIMAYPADQWIPWSVTGDPNDTTAQVLLRESTVNGVTTVAVEVH